MLDPRDSFYILVLLLILGPGSFFTAQYTVVSYADLLSALFDVYLNDICATLHDL